MSADDVALLQRCIELAREARDRGDQPFGSVLVAGNGSVLEEARNSVTTDADITAHPELRLARWAARHLDVDERAAATMYTSGEHCPMCATAHAYAGIGRLVFAFSSAQLAEVTGRRGWQLSVRELFERGGVSITVDGPFAEVEHDARALHA